MRGKWITALVGVAAVSLMGGFFLARTAFGTPHGMMGKGHGMMGNSALMQGIHNRMMGGGGDESIPSASARPGAPLVEQTVTIREWSMSPSDLKVEAGARLRLTIKNEGTMFHNFAIPDLGVRLVNIPPGETRTVELNTDAAGSYTFRCDIGGHAQAGQQGKLTVDN